MKKLHLTENPHAALAALYLLAPVLGELVSGSSPPPEFFSLPGFVLLTLLYGGGALLIRETTIRWHLGWSRVFLCLAYGVLEEGLACKTLFDSSLPKLGTLSHYGFFFTVQWSWTLMVLTFHATISTLVAISLTDLSFPKYAGRPIAHWVTLCAVAFGLLYSVTAGFLFFPDAKRPSLLYVPQTLGCVLAIMMLLESAYRCRSLSLPQGTARHPPMRWAVAGMLFQALIVFMPLQFSAWHVWAAFTIALQAGVALAGAIMVITGRVQLQNSARHLRSLIFGSLAFYAVADLFLPHGMLFVGIGTIVAGGFWWRALARIQGD